MRASAVQVADILLAAMPPVKQFDDGTAQTSLAVCLSQGNGAFRVGSSIAIVLVLCDPTSCQTKQCLHVVRSRLAKQFQATQLRTTQQVAHRFRKRTRDASGHLGNVSYRTTWAAVRAEVVDHVPFMGPAGVEPVATTDAGINWFDLASLDSFPIGCIIWRWHLTRDNTSTLVVDQRLTDDWWICLTIANAVSATKVTALLRSNEITSIEPISGQAPLVHTPK